MRPVQTVLTITLPPTHSVSTPLARRIEQPHPSPNQRPAIETQPVDAILASKMITSPDTYRDNPGNYGQISVRLVRFRTQPCHRSREDAPVSLRDCEPPGRATRRLLCDGACTEHGLAGGIHGSWMCMSMDR